jgi:hypothetical protein
MTPEDEQCRDVYAHFGVAAYFAQCFEKFLSNFLLLHARATKTNLTVKDIDDLEEFLHKKKTLGMLLKDVGAVVTHNSSSEQLVKDALKGRNFLMHHYFWARAEKFMTAEGRAAMIAELEELRDLFQRAEFFATALCKSASQPAGIPWDHFETAAAKFHPLLFNEICDERPQPIGAPSV